MKNFAEFCESSALNLFQNNSSLKLNDKGFGTLDVMIDKAVKDGDNLADFKQRVELVFGTKDERETKKFIKKNVNTKFLKK